jgi:hypothetical protein
MISAVPIEILTRRKTKQKKLLDSFMSCVTKNFMYSTPSFIVCYKKLLDSFIVCYNYFDDDSTTPSLLLPPSSIFVF